MSAATSSSVSLPVYLCPVEECASFSTFADLHAHLASVHCQYTPFTCQVCSKRLPTEQRCTEHFMTVHAAAGHTTSNPGGYTIEPHKHEQLERLIDQWRKSSTSMVPPPSPDPQPVSQHSTPIPFNLGGRPVNSETNSTNLGGRPVNSGTNSTNLGGLAGASVKIEQGGDSNAQLMAIKQENMNSSAGGLVKIEQGGGNLNAQILQQQQAVKPEFMNSLNSGGSQNTPTESGAMMEEGLLGGLAQTHECPICQKTFGNAYNFERHSKVHDPGNKQYQCSVCTDYYVASHGAGRRHLATCHRHATNVQAAIINVHNQQVVIQRKHIRSGASTTSSPFPSNEPASNE